MSSINSIQSWQRSHINLLGDQRVCIVDGSFEIIGRRSLGRAKDHWGQADVFIVANIVERCLNFGCFDLAKTNYDEPFVRNTA